MDYRSIPILGGITVLFPYAKPKKGKWFVKTHATF
jgi:hypothetical protein